MVLEPSGKPVARGVTDQQGRFRLATSPTTGKGRAAPKTVYPLRLRVLRMGFRPREIPLTAASAGTYWDVSLVSFPIQLEEVQVVALTCPQRPDRKQALGLLRQVRMSLLANVVARSQSSATMQRLLYERRYEGGSGRIAGQTVRRRVTSSTTESFSAARSAAAFSRQGFIEDSTGVFFRLIRMYYHHSFRELFLTGQGPLEVHRAAMSILAGHVYPRPAWPLRWRFWLLSFFIWFNRYFPISPRRPRFSLVDAEPGT